MTLNIRSFENTVRQAQQQQRIGDGLSIGEGNQVQLKEPLNPPGKWSQFKALLSDIPLLKNLSGIRQARTQMDNYRQQVNDLQISNRQVMQNFMQCLQDECGPHVADMSMRDIDQINGTPLTSRTVTKVIENARQESNVLKARNNFSMMRFLENTTTGGMRALGDKDMIGLFLDRGINLHGNIQW